MSDVMLSLGHFFTRWEQADDDRAAFREGGREGGYIVYRTRDKVHGAIRPIPRGRVPIEAEDRTRDRK